MSKEWVTARTKEAQRLAGWFMRWAVVLFLVAVIAITILAEANLPPDFWTQSPYFLLSLIGAMIFFFRHDVTKAHEELEQKVAAAGASLAAEVTAETGEMQAVTSRIEHAQRQIEDSVGTLSVDVRVMQETLHSAGKLRSLDEALKDLAPRFADVQAAETVRIDHLGLNMSTAWDRLCPVIQDLVDKKARVYFRLLILSKEAAGGVEGAASPVALPAAVKGWLPGVDERKLEIEQALDEMRAEAPAGAVLDYEVRSYRDLPVVHGIRVHIGEKFKAAYVSLCRWRRAKEFWWGGDEYHCILGDASQEQGDLREILSGYFERWWEMNKPIAGVATAAAAETAPIPRARRAKK